MPTVNGKRPSRATVFRWVKAGKLRSQMFGGRRVVSQADLDAFLSSMSTPTSEPSRSSGVQEVLRRYGVL